MGLKIPIPKSFQIPIWEYPILKNGSKFKPFQSKRDICEIPILILNFLQLLNIPIQQNFFCEKSNTNFNCSFKHSNLVNPTMKKLWPYEKIHVLMYVSKYAGTHISVLLYHIHDQHSKM
jgi:hypothetical protein